MKTEPSNSVDALGIKENEVLSLIVKPGVMFGVPPVAYTQAVISEFMAVNFPCPPEGEVEVQVVGSSVSEGALGKELPSPQRVRTTPEKFEFSIVKFPHQTTITPLYWVFLSFLL